LSVCKKSMKARRNLLPWLEKQELQKAGAIKTPSDHYVAACGAVLAAWKWFRHESVWIHAVERPFHPFDYACLQLRTDAVIVSMPGVQE